MPECPPEVTLAELESCTRILEAISGNSMLLSQLTHAERIRLLVAAGRVVRPDKDQVRMRLRAQRRAKREATRSGDRALRAATSIRLARLDSVFVPAPRLLADSAEAQAPELQ